MAQQQQQTQQYWGPTPRGQGTPRHRPGKLLLGDITCLQRQQAAASSTGAQAVGHPWRAANVLSTLALVPDSNSSSSEQESVQGLQQYSEHELTQQALHPHQQQQQQALPFWKGPLQQPQKQQAYHSQAEQHQHQQDPQQPSQHQQQLRHSSDPQQHPRVVTFRPGSVGPQFASATLSGSSSSGSGSDSPTALKAVGRVFGNGEICKLLGFIGAQLLMQFASIQHGMHQLHQRQQGLSSGEQQQQQQGPGFGGWRVRMPWQRQEGAGGAAEAGVSHGASSRSNAAWQAGEAAKQWVCRGIVAERNVELREALACYTNAGKLAHLH